jgi:hypothetical protein
MPLVTCPDCGHDISDLAPTCIHCGRPMQTAVHPAAAPASPPYAAEPPRLDAASPGNPPPPARSAGERPMAPAAPATLPKPVAGIATVLVIGGAGLIWSMMPAHPKDPNSVYADLAVVSRGLSTLGNSAAIIGALMAAMDHRAGHKLVRVTAWLMIPAMLLLILLGWSLLGQKPEMAEAGAPALLAAFMVALVVIATAPWLLFLYLFRKSRYG